MARRAFTIPFVLSAAVAFAAAPSRRVVIVVWDGMRPDFISAANTPHLWELGRRGVMFAHHHPVYLSSTEVNGTAMATGAYPAHSFVIANVDFRPLIDPQKPVAIENPATIRKGDEASGGRYLGRPTVPEILHAREIATVVAGSKQVALLFDRAPRTAGATVSPVLFEGATLPAELAVPLAAAQGAFPPVAPDQDKIARDAWTTQALLGSLWRSGVPAYTVLWLAEPDFSQHATGPGSPQSLAAIRGCDRDLGLVIADLDRRGLLGSTDVMVVSDHGFSTISRKIDVAAALVNDGFNVRRTAPGGLQPGEVLAVGDGGTTLFYVGAHDPGVCRRLAADLQTHHWTGVVFAREPADGTFPLADAHIDSPQAPDLVAAFHWTADASENGTPGMQDSDLSPQSKTKGSHASLSAFDMHNTLVAAGPDFLQGVTDTLPSANTDLAPTVLWCLGLHQEALAMDGRVLSEALGIEAPPLKSYDLRRLTARRATAGGEWRQYLQISEVNGVRYLDEGDGGWSVRRNQ